MSEAGTIKNKRITVRIDGDDEHTLKLLKEFYHKNTSDIVRDGLNKLYLDMVLGT